MCLVMIMMMKEATDILASHRLGCFFPGPAVTRTRRNVTFCRNKLNPQSTETDMTLFS